jgi:hypothetical protein
MRDKDIYRRLGEDVIDSIAPQGKQFVSVVRSTMTKYKTFRVICLYAYIPTSSPSS